MKPRAHVLVTMVRWASLAGLLLFGAGAAIVLLQPTDATWWAARLLGLAALLLMAAALVLPPAPGRPHRHGHLGWMAFAALIGHVAAVAGLQSAFWRWLTWAIPIEIAAGIAAAAAFVVAFAVERARRLGRRLGPLPGHRIHRLAGHVLVAAAALHVALVAGTSLAAAILVAAGLVLFMIAGIAGERHGRALAATLALFALAAAALTVGPLAGSRLKPLRRAPIDHANFLHADHAGLACAGCHHSFIDRAGNENCLSCHKRISTTEAMRVDRMLHVFCADCHRADKRAGKKFGPIDDCYGCHVKPKRLGP
jgi:hypothetical protein